MRMFSSDVNFVRFFGQIFLFLILREVLAKYGIIATSIIKKRKKCFNPSFGTINNCKTNKFESNINAMTKSSFTLQLLYCFWRGLDQTRSLPLWRGE